MTKRIATDTLWDLLNQPPVGREDYLARLYMVRRQQRRQELPKICRDCNDWDWAGAQPDWETKDARWKKAAATGVASAATDEGRGTSGLVAEVYR